MNEPSLFRGQDSIVAVRFISCDLHALPLHDVDVILRASVVTIQTQGAPEVGPQLAVASDKRSNYFSVEEKGEWAQRW